MFLCSMGEELIKNWAALSPKYRCYFPRSDNAFVCDKEVGDNTDLQAQSDNYKKR